MMTLFTVADGGLLGRVVLGGCAVEAVACYASVAGSVTSLVDAVATVPSIGADILLQLCGYLCEQREKRAGGYRRWKGRGGRRCEDTRAGAGRG
jgi:hypothetical protein